ncbi:MAG: glycosyltransferase [Acidobacteria bacterium]|nr:MAG: glycosyltransferase [Acidobacteriota bacterium]
MPVDTAVVVPCFDEAERLDGDEFLAHLDRDPRVRFEFVDDGSSDGTPELLERIVAAAGGRARLTRLERNRGKAEAVRRGMLAALAAGPTFAGYWDADLSTPLEAVGELRAVLESRPEIALVLGSRVKLLGRTIERSAVRHYAGRIFATAASWTLGWPVYDTQCGAKLFRVTEATRGLFDEPFLSGWAFDVELLIRFDRALAERGRPALEAVVEHPLAVWRDRPGSKVRPWDLLRAIHDLVRVRAAYSKRSRRT